jgi:hypothetical protein
MTYDGWKSTNPADEFLGSTHEDDGPPADVEETGAHVIDDPVCTSCGNFLRDDEIEAGTCDDCDYESAMESIADERGEDR